MDKLKLGVVVKSRFPKSGVIPDKPYDTSHSLALFTSYHDRSKDVEVRLALANESGTIHVGGGLQLTEYSMGSIVDELLQSILTSGTTPHDKTPVVDTKDKAAISPRFP